MTKTSITLLIGFVMKISARCKYALQAVLEMSKAPAGTVLKVADIAAKPHIPAEYLVQVLILLKTAGIVESIRGKMGGYRLSRSPARITVADVVEAVEGTGQPAEGIGGAVLEVLSRADEASKSVLDETTFADLLAKELERRQSPSYAI